MKKPSFTKSLIALLLFFSPCYLFSQTFFAVSANPTDGNAHAGPNTTVTPPANMAANDLAIVYAQYRGNAATISMNAGDGQSWNNAVVNYSPAGSNQTVSVFWCTFNGSWSANPIVTIGSGTNGFTAVMYVFRPGKSNSTWGVDASPANSTSAAMTGNSITAAANTASNTVTMAFWSVGATNTWGSLSGASWIKTGLTAQYRNTTTGQSHSAAYNIMTSAGTPAAVAQNQSAGTTALRTIMSWKEYPANDNCANAISITSATTCMAGVSSLTNQTLNGGTVEGAGIATSCGGATTSQDVWYKFVAQSPHPTITVSNLGASWGTSLRVQLLSGSCGSLTEIGCANNTSLTPSSALIVGNTYYIRVLKNNTTAPAGAAAWAFDICVTGPSVTVASNMQEVFQVSELTTGPGGASGTRFYDPWEVTYGPDDSLWITEAKSYKVYKMNPNGGAKRTILDLSPGSSFTPASFKLSFPSGFTGFTTGGYSGGGAPQGGMAGFAIHPKFPDSPYVFVSYIWKFVKKVGNGGTANTTLFAANAPSNTWTTTTGTPANGGIYYQNALVRFTFNSTTGQLGSPMAVCDTLPGGQDHNSQRIIIAPVGNTYYLFYACGDMGAGQFANSARPENAQVLDSYEGKILRFNVDPDNAQGTYDQWIPDTNPFNATLGKQSAVWAFGFRNNQGFAYAKVNGNDHIYGQQHGPFSDDEINELQGGGNYGHPLVIGYKKDGNFNGVAAGNPTTNWTDGSGKVGGLPIIGDETHNADSMNQFHTYHDPIFSYYPAPAGSPLLADMTKTTPVPSQMESVQYIYYWFNRPSPNTVQGNQYWRSEAPSGLDAYTNSKIPGWKNSLISCIMKGTPGNTANWTVETSTAGKIGSPKGATGSGTAASGKLMRLKLNNTGSGLVVSPLNADSTLKIASAYSDDTVAYFTSRNRFRDVAISKDGLSLFAVIDSSQTTSGPTQTNPANSLCKGCLLKYTFLGYNVSGSGNRSYIPTTNLVADGIPGSFQTANKVVINANNSNNNLWVPITDTNSNVVAEINARGYNLDTVTTTLFTRTGFSRSANGLKYVNRNMTIKPQQQPADSVWIRLYISKTEFDQFVSDGGSGAISALKILKNEDSAKMSITQPTTLVNTTISESFNGTSYVLQGTIGAFSSFYFSNSAIIPLPLHLLTFRGTLQNSSTLLDWETTNEVNTSKFIVERSTDGRNFQPIGTVLAVGNSSLKNKYSFTDYDVTRQSSTVVYYRLKIVDQDEAYEYSDIVTITLPLTTSRVALYPNPASHEVNVTITTAIDGKVRWQLIDHAGRIVAHNTMAAKKGNNNLVINLNRLSTGTYFLIVSGADIDQKVKLEKL
jgi:glucose/arabinose dehydrogenase